MSPTERADIEKAGSSIASTAALYAICAGVLLTVLDTTIVTVALPSIAEDLRLAGAALTWIVNAYTLAFGGTLLLAGTAADLFGARTAFLVGVVGFTGASVACGVAQSEGVLIAARACQGLAGAAVNAASLALITELFTIPAQRARAMGVYGFVCAVGGCLGQLCGGVLVDLLSWHWIFLVNVPIGIGVYALALLWVPGRSRATPSRGVDVLGTLTSMLAITLTVYAVVNGTSSGSTHFGTLTLLAAVVVLLILFGFIERRAQHPIIPFGLFRAWSFTSANVVGVVWTAGSFAWFVMYALYLRAVLGYGVMAVALTYLPVTAVTAVVSLLISPKASNHFGPRTVLCLGLLFGAAGMALSTHGGAEAQFATDLLPELLLLGLGEGLVCTPLLILATQDVRSAQSGIASGIVNTCLFVGGAIGLAGMAGLAEARARSLTITGTEQAAALLGGYQFAFVCCAFLALAAALVVMLAGRPSKATSEVVRL